MAPIPNIPFKQIMTQDMASEPAGEAEWLPEVMSAMLSIQTGITPRLKKRIAINQMKVQAQAREADANRRVDQSTTPYMEADMLASEERERSILSRIAEMEKTLAGTPNLMSEPKLTTGEMIAGGIGALMGMPAQSNEAIMGTATNRMNFQNKQAQEQWTREQEVNGLKYKMLMQQLNSEDDRQNQILSERSKQYFEQSRRDWEEKMSGQEFDRKAALQESENKARLDLENLKQTAMSGRAKDKDAIQMHKLNWDQVKDHPEARAKYVADNGADPALAAMLATLTPKEANLTANTGLTVSKTKTEDELRAARVAKMNNEAKAILGRIALDEVRKKKIEQETALLLPKYQLEAAKVQANLAKSNSDELTPANIDKALARYKKMRDMYAVSLKKYMTYNNQTGNWEYLPGKEFHPDVLDLRIAIDEIDKKSLALSQQRPADMSGQPRGANSGRVLELQGMFNQAFPGSPSEIAAPTGGRNIAGTTVPSLHNTNEAIDLRGGNLKAKAAWAINQPGVQTVIYNGQIWSPSSGWRKYTGQHPHTDHVHVDYGRGGQPTAAKKTSPKKKPTGSLQNLGGGDYFYKP